MHSTDRTIHKIIFIPASRVVELVDSDNNISRITSSRNLPIPEGIEMVELDNKNNALRFSLTSQNCFTIEPLVCHATTIERPLIIYLDQNHLSNLIKATIGELNEPIHKKIADRLERLITEKRVAVPLSAGHLLELQSFQGSKRKELALGFFRLSRGWQTLHPNSVWQNEILNYAVSYRQKPELVSTLEVFTRTPDDVFSDLNSNEQEIESNWLPVSNETLTAFSGYMSLLDTLMNCPSNPNTESILDKWASGNNAIRNLVVENNKTKQYARKVALGNLLLNNLEVFDLTRKKLELSEKESLELLSKVKSLSNDMPCFSLFMELSVKRILDKNYLWAGNDIFDLTYLTLGTAYADVIVGERSTTAQLQQLLRNNVYRHATILSTIQELDLFLEKRFCDYWR
jgi:hypothetical protein